MAGKHRRPRSPARGRHRKPGQLAALGTEAVPAAMTAALALPAATAGFAPAGAAAVTPSAPAAAAQLTAWHMPAPAAASRQPARVTAYRIRAGDTLSSISARFCSTPADYPGLAAGNGIGNPDLIMAGRELRITCRTVPAAARARAGGKIWGVTYGYPDYCGDGDGDGWDVACSSRVTGTATARPAYRRAGHRSYSGSSSQRYSGSSSFEQCVISRESGGNSQVMNASGHYGLYQFSASTWQAYGGSASSFGHASVGEQKRVFDNAIAQGGQSNWSPYDGC